MILDTGEAVTARVFLFYDYIHKNTPILGLERKPQNNLGEPVTKSLPRSARQR